MNRFSFFLGILISLPLSNIYAQNSVTPKSITSEATYENIGIVWTIDGDNNLNSKLIIEYKLSGSSTYLPTYRTMRANPNSNVDGSLLSLNHHAGSIVGLSPNTSYDIRLTLTDPDGGGKTDNITVTTKAEITKEYQGTISYVIPGTGGGTGTQSDPYRGLQEAANNAVPGSVFHLASGTYTNFTLTTSGTADAPIVFTANLSESAIIDGKNTTSGIITLGSFSDIIQHVVIENITIKNGKWGIDAQNTRYVTVRHCTFRDVDYGYINRRENGHEHDQTISDNYFYGRTAWPVPTGSIPSERCIDLRGNRNVIRYNLIRNFGDGVSTDGLPYKKSYALDIHNNDISYIGDDIIEVDGMVANTRIWRNKGSNGRMGVSLAPVFGGPCYVYRNDFNNMETSIYKMNRKPAGLIIIHNSAIKTGRGTTSDSGWHNTILRNNVLISSHYVFEEYSIPATSLIEDWDYNAYSTIRNGTSGEPWFKWNNIKYAQISDLRSGSGQEMNGLQFDYTTAIASISLPTLYENGVAQGSYDFSLSASSPLIDKGENIPNINDNFVTDGSPDIGAYEFGQPIPHYGPRTASPDDVTPPIITLKGDNPQIIQEGDGYTELGATTDDGSDVVIDSSNFEDTIGAYTITYNATDNSGNIALEVIRTVNVVDQITTPPTPITETPFMITYDPETNVLDIQTDEDIQKLKVYCFSGKKVIELSPNQKEFEINLENLADGAYILKIDYANHNSTFETKIIKF